MKYKNILIIYVIILILPIPILLAVVLTSSMKDYKVIFSVGQQEYASFKTMGRELIELPADPIKEGHTFVGWYMEDETELKLDIYKRKRPTSNITVYAKFTINKYTITFNTNDGKPVSSTTEEYGSDVTAPNAPKRVGYSFLGWYLNENTLGNRYEFTTMPAANFTLYAKWEITTCRIEYNLDGGANGNNPQVYNYETADFVLEPATKIGHTFHGWYTEETFTNKITMIDKSKLLDYTLYALFTANKYTITFNTNGGTSVDPITQEFGSPVAPPANPVRNGYAFIRWCTDENLTYKYTFSTMPLNGITLYAQWQALEWNNTYEIVQTSDNYIGDDLSKVTIKCNTHSKCTVWWEDNSKILDYAYEEHNVIHKSNATDKMYLCKASVSAIAKLDSQKSFQDMIFTLNASNNTASVRAKHKLIETAIIPARVEDENGIIYSVTKIDNQGFYNIENLKTLYVPATLQEKDNGSTSFSNCDRLETVILDKNLTFLNPSMFSFCANLNYITLPEKIVAIPSTFLYFGGSKPKDIIIPDNVKEIGASAFYGCALRSIKLPEGLETIGNTAFGNTSYLTSIEIPSTVTSIGHNAFWLNSGLKEVKILSKNITIGYDAFLSCSSLQTIYLTSKDVVKSINSNTADSTYMLSYLKHNAIMYVHVDVGNALKVSEYMKAMFESAGLDETRRYNAYRFMGYGAGQTKILNLEERIYALNAVLHGDEQIQCQNGTVWESVPITDSMLENFNTSTPGRKTAKLTYMNVEQVFNYYVLDSQDVASTSTSTQFNCIYQVNNFYPTYYVNENVNFSHVEVYYVNNNNGYMQENGLSSTEFEVLGFNTGTTGTKTVTFKYQDGTNVYTYDLGYYVKEKPTEKITSESFKIKDETANENYYDQYYVNGTCFDEDKTLETEHFIVNIAKGTYVACDYGYIFERIYAIQEQVTGLKFLPGKITVNIDEKNSNYATGNNTIILNPYGALICSNFDYHLARLLTKPKVRYLGAPTVSQALASYISHRTSKYIYETDREFYSYCRTQNSFVYDFDSLSTQLFVYDFENYLLHLYENQLVSSSTQEAGFKMYAYFDYITQGTNKTFCSWVDDDNFNPKNLEEWKTAIKEYYNNQNLFEDMYQAYYEAGRTYNNFFNMQSKTNFYTSTDKTSINKYNFYFELRKTVNRSFMYKDLYVNIDSARDQLEKLNVKNVSLSLRASRDVAIELYTADGTLIRTVTNSRTQFSLEGVSFIKLVGTNYATFTLSYE